jgi:hypothetical protein
MPSIIIRLYVAAIEPAGHITCAGTDGGEGERVEKRSVGSVG